MYVNLYINTRVRVRSFGESLAEKRDSARPDRDRRDLVDLAP